MTSGTLIQAENVAINSNIVFVGSFTFGKLSKKSWVRFCVPVNVILRCSGSSWSVVAERSNALDSSSDVVRMWVRILAWPVTVLVSLSKTLNHNCFVLRMGSKAVWSGVLCNARKRTQDTYREREGACLEHPAGWICARYKSSVLLSSWMDVPIHFLVFGAFRGRPEYWPQNGTSLVVVALKSPPCIMYCVRVLPI